mmetsp:Transcript_23198/g.43911  ORF Transcript_23198/g.43911 Transcript_23198/m.43911 type:complete len:413 (+) Transcript_23198:68-1306(+)
MLRSTPKRPGLQRSGGERFAVIHDEPTSAAQPSSAITTITTTGTNSSTTSSTPVVTNNTFISDDDDDNGDDNGNISDNISDISGDDGNDNDNGYDTIAIEESSLMRGSIDRRTIRIEEERTTLQKLEEITRHLEQATINATTGPPQSNTQRHQLDESEVVVDIVATLTATNARHQQTISQLERRLSESQSRNEDSRRKARSWKKKHSQSEKRNYELIQKMATKALAQIRDQSAMAESNRSDGKIQYRRTDALDENLSAEYATSLRRRRRSEEAREVLREENDALHASVDASLRLASDAADKMEAFARVHETSVANYERRWEVLRDEFRNVEEEKATLDATVEELRGENGVLLRAFEEAEEYFDRDTFTESNREKALKEENKRLRAALSLSSNEGGGGTEKSENCGNKYVTEI